MVLTVILMSAIMVIGLGIVVITIRGRKRGKKSLANIWKAEAEEERIDKVSGGKATPFPVPDQKRNIARDVMEKERHLPTQRPVEKKEIKK